MSIATKCEHETTVQLLRIVQNCVSTDSNETGDFSFTLKEKCLDIVMQYVNGVDGQHKLWND